MNYERGKTVTSSPTVGCCDKVDDKVGDKVRKELLAVCMVVGFPAEVVAEGFFEDIGGVGAGHDDVVFEAVVADVLHEVLEARDAGDCPVAKGVEGVVGEFALAYVGADAAFRVGGGDAAVGEGVGRGPA